MALRPESARLPRQDNRRPALLDAAAHQFARHGFHAASMRDIAGTAGMLPGSIYYHFPSKEALLLAVYEEGVDRIAARVDAAVATGGDPWQRLRAGCAAHLEMLLDRSDYAQVVIRVTPADAVPVRAQLVALRDRYESRFRTLIEDLPLAPGIDRHYLRLLLIGALNWSQTWYRAGGEAPAIIAARFAAIVERIAAAPETTT